MNNTDKRICEHCGYEYQAEKGKWFSKCPNCGMNELRESTDPALINLTVMQEDDGYPD